MNAKKFLEKKIQILESEARKAKQSRGIESK
jgi:hypothetical protein